MARKAPMPRAKNGGSAYAAPKKSTTSRKAMISKRTRRPTVAASRLRFARQTRMRRLTRAKRTVAASSAERTTHVPDPEPDPDLPKPDPDPHEPPPPVPEPDEPSPDVIDPINPEPMRL